MRIYVVEERFYRKSGLNIIGHTSSQMEKNQSPFLLYFAMNPETLAIRILYICGSVVDPLERLQVEAFL